MNRPFGFSPPALETLAVVAYRQPVLRAEVEAIRGVACGEILRQLLDRDLLRIVGRSEELGRPLWYGTTKRFLQMFGLCNLDELPWAAQLRRPAGHPDDDSPNNSGSSWRRLDRRRGSCIGCVFCYSIGYDPGCCLRGIVALKLVIGGKNQPMILVRLVSTYRHMNLFAAYKRPNSYRSLSLETSKMSLDELRAALLSNANSSLPKRTRSLRTTTRKKSRTKTKTTKTTTMMITKMKSSTTTSSKTMMRLRRRRRRIRRGRGLRRGRARRRRRGRARRRRRRIRRRRMGRSRGR